MLSNRLRQARYAYQAREGRPVTITDVAHALGVSRQAVSAWERGVYLPSVAQLARLAALYGVGLGDLLDLEPGEGADHHRAPPGG